MLTTLTRRLSRLLQNNGTKCLVSASSAAQIQPSHSSARHGIKKRRRMPSSKSKVQQITNPAKADDTAISSTMLDSNENKGEHPERMQKLKKYAQAATEFVRNPIVCELASEQGITGSTWYELSSQFITHCATYKPDDEPQLDWLLNDIVTGESHPDELFPHFLEFARNERPHLECVEELEIIANLASPHLWFPDARKMKRTIIYHSGPTNSGKTYQALEAFFQAESAVYCGPLKLLANEIFQKANNRGVPCDLVTGDDRQYGICEDIPAKHVACTVEMLNTTMKFEVAVIDEIQLMRDEQRGFAWTRALLGACAEKVHVCGEPMAINLTNMIVESCGDSMEVLEYERKSPLKVADRALGSPANVEPGDAVICFNKRQIYAVTKQIEAAGFRTAVIYGSLPPTTKMAMANKFNDPNDETKVLVATDAIGMGLNLNIRRIIFNTMAKMTRKADGAGVYNCPLSISQTKQIAGRAGRFNTVHSEGIVTCMTENDMPMLRKNMAKRAEDDIQAGISPTYDMIELFNYHLPHATMTEILKLFRDLCSVDDKYFLVDFDNMLTIAECIDHIPLQLKDRYMFCMAPIKLREAQIVAPFIKIARRYSTNEPITANWLGKQLCDWPPQEPFTILMLKTLESHYDVLDLYLWLSMKRPDMFPHTDIMRDMQVELDAMISCGVGNITHLSDELIDVKYHHLNEMDAEDQDIVRRIAKDSLAETQLYIKDRHRRQKIRHKKILPDNEEYNNNKSITKMLLKSGRLSIDELEQLKTELKKKNKKK